MDDVISAAASPMLQQQGQNSNRIPVGWCRRISRKKADR